jgi:hypothetical protein
MKQYFPGRTTTIIWFFMVNKIQTHIVTAIFHLATPQSKTPLKKNPTDRKMKELKGKTRYQVISFLQELILFFISSFMSFPLHVKRIILCFVYSDDHKPVVVYPSLKEEDLPSSYIVDFDLIPSPQPIENNVVHIQISPDHDQSCELVNNKFHLPPLQIIAPSCNQLTEIHSRIRKGYKPLKLPFILHDFPPNFLDYLPKFNGEDHVTTKQTYGFFRVVH